MAESSSNLGPVELVVLTFPGTRVDATVRAALREVVDRGYVTVLDLIYLSKDADGNPTEVEIIDAPLEDIGLAGLAVDARELLSDDDLALARDALLPGTSALVVVYEQTWARRLAETVSSAGGEVELHVQVPHDSIAAVLAAI